MAHGKKDTTQQIIVKIIGYLVSIAISLWLWSLVSEKGQGRLFRSIQRLIPTVGIATFIGTVVELRNWLHWMKNIIMPLVSFARLPFVSGVAMVTSLFSNKAASSLLAAAYGEERISRKALITTGICDSHFAYLSHAIRVFYPVVAASGITGAIYFGIQFSLGFGILFVALILHRILAKKSIVSEALDERKIKEVPSWKITFQRAFKRTSRILLRLLFITVPMYLLVLYLGQEGVFKTWNALLPAQAAKVITVEMMTIAISMMGGLVNCSTLAGEMIRSGEISSIQVILAMLLGSALGNPVRTLRRNLPSAMGIYPPREGFIIVMVMQSARFVTVLGICTLLYIYIK